MPKPRSEPPIAPAAATTFVQLEPRLRLAHLLRRAGFGPSPGEVEARLGEGYEETVRRLIEPGNEDPDLASLDRHIGTLLDFGNTEDVRTWWTYRMIHSRRPLVEKMTFFWHGHFATSVSKVGKPYLMYRQNQLFREKGLGRFGDLLRGVAQDPAMLVWLDGAGNRKAHPNENFAREVMELFTTGPGVYTETDVQEAARAFTGWHLRDDAFFFNAAEHDAGKKRVLDLEGPLNGDDVLTLFADHTATAERMTRKLFAFFAYDDPEAADVAPLVAVWRKTRGDIREVLRTLFLLPAFSSARAFRAKVKSPAELVIGSIRALGGTIAPRQVVSLMARMGQDLFNPPSVKGWDGGAAWVSTSTLFERMNFAAQVTTARGPQGTSHIDPSAVLGSIAPTSAREMLDVVVDHLLDGRIPEPTRTALLSYLDTPDPQRTKAQPEAPRPFVLDTLMLDEKLRGLLHLVLSTPEFQLG